MKAGILACLAVAVLVIQPARADLPTLRIAVLKFGTVSWLTETVKRRELDRAGGFELDIVPLAGKAATSIAFQAGDVDVIVSDWPWVLRQNATAGLALRFAPYSTALGAVIARAEIDDICELPGHSVGVVGGEIDKSWLVIQALAASRCGVDLAAETAILFGAPPLMSRQLETGTIDAVSTYWPFVARLEADGFRKLIGVEAALVELGIDPPPALVGFVWHSDRLEAGLIGSFLVAMRQAGQALATDDALWEDIRQLMRAGSDAEFEALKAAYRAGIPDRWGTQETENARRLHGLLGRLAPRTVDDAPFDAGIFWSADRDGSNESGALD